MSSFDFRYSSRGIKRRVDQRKWEHGVKDVQVWDCEMLCNGRRGS